MLDDLQFRQLVESEAACLAAKRRTAADLQRIEIALCNFEDAHARGAITHHFDYLFHEAIAIATGNRRFLDSVHALEYQASDGRNMIRHLLYFQPKLQARAVLTEHSKVFDLIRKRDGEGAREAMWNHIEAGRQRLIRHLKKLRKNG